MLNGKVAKAGAFNGRLCALAKRKAQGCVIYGPYERREPGSYRVTFDLGIYDARCVPKLDQAVATIEVVDAVQDIIIERAQVLLSELVGGTSAFTLPFTLATQTTLEYRVHSEGAVNLAVGLTPMVARSDDAPPADDLTVVVNSALLHEQVRETMRLLRPHTALNAVKCRVGREGDGGYIQLDDYEGVDVALSLGINDEVSWDLAVADRGLTVYQFDHTVEDPLPDDDRTVFAKRMIAEHRGPGSETIGDLIDRHDNGGPRPNILLKMDIECSEWSALNSVSEDQLARCSQIVCELHAFQNLWHEDWRQGITSALQKLARHHRVVHVHGNIVGGVTNLAGVIIPNVLEVTFANRHVFELVESDEVFPGPLDISCDPVGPDLYLGNFRF